MNKTYVILGILFFLHGVDTRCVDPSAFFSELGYPQKVTERRLRIYASKAPFSIESQALVDMIFDQELFPKASQKNLIPLEAFLFADAVKSMSSFSAENIQKQETTFFETSREFFSQPLAVEAYLFWVGKDQGTEMKRRAAANAMLLMAIHEGAPAKTIELLLARGVDIDSVDSQENTALLLAAAKGRKDLVLPLLMSGIDYNLANKQGQTALSIALAQADVDMIKALLDRDALIGSCEKGEDAALNVIVKKSQFDAEKYKDIAIFLIKRGADVNNTKSNMPPLMAAVRDNNHAMAQILINHGAEINALVDGISPLRLASRQGDQEMFDLLLNSGAGTDDVDMSGETLLHAAIKNNNLSIARRLFTLGATPNTVNNSGRTPLADAVARGYEEMVQLILVNDGWKMVHHKVDGKLPQELAQENGHTNIFGMVGGYY